MTFHQAVNLGRYNQEKVVSFVPPDGEFELMKYRCQDGISSPFTVLPVITEHGRTRVEVRPALAQPLAACPSDVIFLWQFSRNPGLSLQRIRYGGHHDPGSL